MEPHGIVACAINIWNSGKAWLHVFVSDDDSSSRAALRHSVESRMVIENLLQWPLDSGGKKLRVQENFQLICLNQLFFGRSISSKMCLWKTFVWFEEALQ